MPKPTLLTAKQLKEIKRKSLAALRAVSKGAANLTTAGRVAERRKELKAAVEKRVMAREIENAGRQKLVKEGKIVYEPGEAKIESTGPSREETQKGERAAARAAKVARTGPTKGTAAKETRKQKRKALRDTAKKKKAKYASK